MATRLQDIKKLAQAQLRSRGFYSGEIDGIWGSGSNAAFSAYSDFLDAEGLEIGEYDAIAEDPTIEGLRGVVVLDPGHGGRARVGGSSPNNATSASGVPEKTMTLELVGLIRRELRAIASERPGSLGDLTPQAYAEKAGLAA